ncbi:uncharacterized protein LOC101215034 isoform X2 [Cucumis sativus]|uniref:Trimethylguanosine synthase n=2 Tax=Cucumis sativus TaxID=3659 RepID=A0A0A0L4V8_CUCSA|nr:uncharacterized protein LOC101215034 isoform X2 [Cucumis sativus]KGN55196.1 hypothetical protein Csa_012563 [Cucumis sativus]
MGSCNEESEDEPGVSPIRALGSLFKLTEVFLWDEETEVARRVESRLALDADDANNGKSVEKICSTISGISLLPEDIELTEQMNALGLPLSFHTNKEKRIGITMVKRKANVKHSRIQQGFLDKEVEFPKASSREEIVANSTFNDDATGSLCSYSMVNQSETSDRDVVLDTNEIHVIFDGDISRNSSGVISGAVEEQFCDVMCDIVLNNGGDHELSSDDAVLGDHTKVRLSSIGFDKGYSPRLRTTGLDVGHGKQEEVEPPMESEGSSTTFQDTEVQKSDTDSGIVLPEVAEPCFLRMEPDCNENDQVVGCIHESGDWMVYWDSFYMRNYFYNIKSHESTWNPPLGLEHFASSDANFTPNESTAEVCEMDVLEDVKSEDICRVLGDTECMNLLGDSVHCQPPDALLEGSSSLIEGIESSAFIDTSINCSKDEPQEWLMSCRNTRENIGCSCEGHAKQSCGENCTNGSQFIAANGASEQMMFSHHKPSNMHSPEIDCITIDDDEGTAGLTTSSVSHMLQQADHIDGDMHFANGPIICTLGTVQNLSVRNRKRKMKRTRRRGQLSDRNEGFRSFAITEEYPTSITKYWCQRYQLFSRFDDGIKMDKEGWFSVTPEPIARHHASRCGSNMIIDGFTGVGGNAIQFSQRAKHVIAIDIDPTKIRYAQHNAAIYGVEDQIDFLKGDFFRLAPHLKADVIFLSPPWGGPDYAGVDIYDLTKLKPHDGYFLFNVAKKIAPLVVMFLPKNVNLNQLAELSLSSDPPWSLEVEKNFLNGKLKAITAYLSNGNINKDNVT